MIHGLSLLTLYSFIDAVLQAHAGKIDAHKSYLGCDGQSCRAVLQAHAGKIDAHKSHILGAMGSLVGSGVFTVLSDSMMSQMLFSSFELAGFVAILTLGIVALVI